MRFSSKVMNSRWWWVAAFAAIYFIAYPGDLAAVFGPIDALTSPIRSILSISYSISPWAYVLGVAALVCATLSRIFGKVRGGDRTA